MMMMMVIGCFNHHQWTWTSDLQTDIRSKATNTPIFGAGKTDKNPYAKKKKGGSRPQTEQFEEDIDGLQQAHEKSPR